MTARNMPVVKFAIFAAVMLMLTAALVVVFGQYRTGTTDEYSAVFEQSSGLRPGDTVRIAGVQVGTVRSVELRDDHLVRIDFDADRTVTLTPETTVAARYLNLVGDRYLELVDEPSSTGTLPAGALIPVENTTPALDLDLLLGGLKPVIKGLDAHEVNTLSWSLLEIVQGREGTLDSLMSRTSSFTSTLAAEHDTVTQLVEHLNTVMSTLADEGDRFAGTIERLEQLVRELAGERDPLGAAIIALDDGTAALSELLVQARPPLDGVVDELARLAPILDDDKDTLDAALERAPGNFRKLVRTGAYGNFIQYYICAITVRVNDPDGEVMVMPWIEQTTGRCSP